MCHPSCVAFVEGHLRADEVRDKRILEVGAYDVNGSPRPSIEALLPAEYIGVDISEGPGVDLVCPAENLEERFGACAFDVIVTTETLEHVRDWRVVLHNLKQCLVPGGLLIVTTRSKGFPLHSYPSDFWRYSIDDMRLLFSDFVIEVVEADLPEDPGVFVRARRPDGFIETDLSGIALYSMITASRALSAEQAEEQLRLEAGVARLLALRRTLLFRSISALRKPYLYARARVISGDPGD